MVVIPAVVGLLSFACGVCVGWLWLRSRVIREVQELVQDCIANHAVADRLTTILGRVSEDELKRVIDQQMMVDGAELLEREEERP